MADPTPSSRSDFSINAFALLPPSVPYESAASCDPIPVLIAAERPTEEQKDGSDVDASTENPMVLLKLNLAHTELCETVETLYQAIDSLEGENEALRRANARLMETQERAKTESVTAEEQFRRKFSACRHENTQLTHKMRDLERNKARLVSEMEEFKLVLSGRDSTISALRDTVNQLEREQERLGDFARQEAELQQLVEMWSSKERAVAENTNHVRKAIHAAQRLSEQQQSQLKQVQSELQSAAKDHQTFRGYLADHKCTGSGTEMLDGVDSTLCQELNSLRSQIRTFEQDKMEKFTQMEALRTRCAEYKKNIQALSHRLDKEKAQEAANKSLLAKYAESAADGTQTIAELQESLVKLCDQLAQERKEFGDRLSERLRTSVDQDALHQQQALESETELRKVIHELEDAQAAARNAVPNRCERCISTHNASTVFTQPDEVDKDHAPVPILFSPPQAPQRHTTIVQSHHKNERASNRLALDSPAKIEDAIEDSDSELEAKQTARKNRSTGRQNQSQYLKQSTSCRLCNEEPFGFMVRCQKCKDPFHAGCVKNSVAGTKKRLGHIFKCSNCAPQRPTKVARTTIDQDVSKECATTGADIRSEQQTAPLQVPVSRTSIIARPSTRADL